MGYPTKVQRIKRESGADQWYTNFPAAVARAMDFEQEETVEWTVLDRERLLLSRLRVPELPEIVETCVKKKRAGRFK